MPRILWLCLTGLLSLAAWMSQVGPDDAISNLAKWYSKVAAAPDWLKYPALDTAWTIAFGLMAAICFVVFFMPPNLLSPKRNSAPKNLPDPVADLSTVARSIQGIRKARYAPPDDAKDFDIATLKYKELGELMESTGHDVLKFRKSAPYNATEEMIISQFHKKMAPGVLWVYEEAKRRGHHDSTIENFYSDPQKLRPMNIEWLGKSLITMGAGLALYIDA